MDSAVQPAPQFLTTSDGSRLAFDRIEGAPGVVFLHGLMSDRGGTKAMAIEAHCRARGYGFVRFDMFGHGASDGSFQDGTISRWTQDALAVVDQLTTGPQILIGSSMGGWVMTRAATARPDRIAAVLGIAVAPDFTADMTAAFSAEQSAALQSKGLVHIKSEYDERPYPISRVLIEDGGKNLVLGADIPLTCPVRLLHGQRDDSVPWQKSLAVADKVTSGDVEVILIKDGDHRLSRPQDLARLCSVLDDLAHKVRP